MKKTFVLRQQALTSSEKITMSFGSDNEVVIPMTVYDTLKHKKNLPAERRSTATRVLNYLEEIPTKEMMDFSKGYKQENGSVLYLLEPISHKFSEKIQKTSGIDDYDKKIFQLCLDLEAKGRNVCLISKSPYIRKKADILGIKAEPFKDELAPALKDQYTGKGGMLVVSPETFEKLFNGNEEDGFSIDEIIEKPESLQFFENMFFKVTSTEYKQYNVDKYILGRYTDGKIVPLKYYREAQKNGCIPKNDDQKMLLECLFAPPEIAPLVVVKGAAGAGKTFCTIATALSKLIRIKSTSPYGSAEGIYEQVILAAPVIDMEELGALPGEIDNKMGPFIKGVKDNIRNYHKTKHPEENHDTASKYANNFMNSRFLELAPATHMRGRSLEKSFIIIDEAQNYHPSLILDITTRAAEKSKIIFLGDPTQINNPECTSRYNGLVYASETMKGDPLTWQITLKDSVRSPLAEAAIRRMKK